MRDGICRFIKGGLLAVSVLFGPWMWLIAFESSRLVWQQSTDPALILHLLLVSFIMGCWAVWGLVVAPAHIRGWWFLVASLSSAYIGVRIILGLPAPARWSGLLFIAYSLWQFFIFRRKP